METHPQGVILPQHPAKLGRDPLRRHGRHLGPQTDKLDVLDPPKLGQNPLQPFVAQRQGISTREQHVADGRGFPYVIQGLLQPGLPGHDLTVAHDPRPRTVPAIGRAEIVHQQQNSIRIAMNQAGNRAVPLLAERVVGLPGGLRELRRRRHNRSSQRLTGIVGGYQAHVVRRDPHRQQHPPRKQRFPLRARQNQHLLQPVQRADSVLDLPSPVVPVSVGQSGKEGSAKRSDFRARPPTTGGTAAVLPGRPERQRWRAVRLYSRCQGGKGGR